MKEFAEGLLISTYALVITFLVLTLFGFVLSLFRHVFAFERTTVKTGEVVLEKEVRSKLQAKKRAIAITVALNEYMREKTKPITTTRRKRAEREISRILKSKRWKNG